MYLPAKRIPESEGNNLIQPPNHAQISIPAKIRITAFPVPHIKWDGKNGRNANELWNLPGGFCHLVFMFSLVAPNFANASFPRDCCRGLFSALLLLEILNYLRFHFWTSACTIFIICTSLLTIESLNLPFSSSHIPFPLTIVPGHETPQHRAHAIQRFRHLAFLWWLERKRRNEISSLPPTLLYRHVNRQRHHILETLLPRRPPERGSKGRVRGLFNNDTQTEHIPKGKVHLPNP